MVDKDPNTQKETGTVSLNDVAGNAKTKVYTKTQVDTLVNNAVTFKKDASETATTSVMLTDVTGTNSAEVYTSAQAEAVAQQKVDALANGAVAKLQKVIRNDDNNTLVRGGTDTTALQLTDQDKNGATQSGANFGSTIYANGVEQTATLTDADYIALGGTAATDPNTNTVSSTQAVDGLVYYTASNKPTTAPANAIGVMRETTAAGVTSYKYITGTRLSGVAAGQNVNDAVNKGQLDALSDALNNISGGSL